jgi:NADH-quinone oxidoreductase subunit N
MNLALVTTEILVVCLATFILIVDLIIPKGESRQGLGIVTIFGLLAILGFTFTQFNVSGTLYKGIYVIDQYALFFKQLFLAAGVLTVMFSLDYIGRLRNQGEFYSLLVFALLGMMVMASANDLITLFVGMELMTITFYVLVGSNIGDQKSSEAGMKYLILGAASSAVLLYGMSLVYGAAGSVLLKEIAASAALSPALVVGVVLTLVGFSFKTASVPFHMWSPDVYEGAPVPITALLAMASKAAGFTVLVRVFLVAFPGIEANWIAAVCVLSAVSMILGNVIAIPQTNIKRMLAYSSIAQAGYMLSGLIAADAAGVKGILFYAMLYVFASAGAFAVVTAVHQNKSSDAIDAYAGLSQRAPLLAAVMTVSLLSMAGIPPLAGFVGKFYLFAAVVQKGYLWVAFIGFIMSMVSVYYYLLVAKAMYMREPADTAPFAVGGPLRWAAVVSMLLTILFGVYPAPLSEIANAAAKSLM